MLFNSWEFIVHFLPPVVLIFCLVPSNQLRKFWLIAASLYFYSCWNFNDLYILGFSIVFNYLAALLLRALPKYGRATVLCGVFINLALLGYFKYSQFVLVNLNDLLRTNFTTFPTSLPLAISFFTFTQIGYLVDVYRSPEKHYGFLDYCLFVTFFPHLIAGPIIRHWEIIPQFSTKGFGFNATNLAVGTTYFVLGYYEKSLANIAALSANPLFDSADHGALFSASDAWLGTLAFGLQIYFDFASYSDMAIGLARLFGITFPFNFNSPYRAVSIMDFWERWHSSLTRFLREYLYFSLGGNRKGKARQMVNLMLTMLLSGLWHGAGWTYIFWGGLHGIFLMISHLFNEYLRNAKVELNHWIFRVMGVVLTFSMVHFAWIFFRAKTFTAATTVISVGLGFYPGNHSLIDPYTILPILLVLLMISTVIPNAQELLSKYHPVLEPLKKPSRFCLELNALTGTLIGCLIYLMLRNTYVEVPAPFIYWKF